jgi:hypothetical protein
LLLSTTAAFNSSSWGMTVDGVAHEIRPIWEWGPLYSGKIVARFSVPRDHRQVSVNCHLAPCVSIEPGICALDEGESVTSDLWRLLSKVEGTVRSFAEILNR